MTPNTNRLTDAEYFGLAALRNELRIAICYSVAQSVATYFLSEPRSIVINSIPPRDNWSSPDKKKAHGNAPARICFADVRRAHCFALTHPSRKNAGNQDQT